jgi:ADP-ribose pyrophosphatase YjhB (NUDIX family)
MRRRRRLGLADIPRLLVGGAVNFAGLFGGRYGRTEGAHVLATDDAGRILVVRTTYLGPEWMLPGGRVERRETPHAAAARETLEETGIEVEVERLLLADARRPDNVSFVFAARATGGEMAPQFGEIAEVGWLERPEICATSPQLDRLLEMIDQASEGAAYVGITAPDE